MMKKTIAFGLCHGHNGWEIKSYNAYLTEYCTVAKINEKQWAVIDPESGVTGKFYTTRKEALANYPEFERMLTKAINEKFEDYEMLRKEYNKLKEAL